MELTESDVLEILKLFEQSKFDYLHLEEGGRKITVSKTGFTPSSMSAASPPLPAAPHRAANESQPPALERKQPTPALPSAPADLALDPGLVSVAAPMVGTFYAAPSPSDPPFVQLGERVAPGGALGLVEVMKVFTSVIANVAGVVERILVANGQSVEQGQILFLIRPE